MGRELELGELSHSLTLPDRRLLTLVGPGGIGKTRLSLEAARRALTAGAFPDGVFFVGLEALREADEVPGAIADTLALEVPDAGKALGSVREELGSKHVLLVLDNVEQLSGVNEPISSLLESCPHLTVLVTSRHRLSAANEWVVALSGLTFPDASLSAQEAALFDAPRLFQQRARQAGLRIDLERELDHVLRLCRLLEGAPLGLELAATWTQLLSCGEIADEVERSYDILGSGEGRDAERQGSLRAVFSHSWSLLSPAEQRALRRLSLARGGFTRDLAREIADCDLQTLLSLAGKSLIERGGAGRFRVLEVTREYALERLREDPEDLRDARRRHVRHFVALAQDGESGLRGDRQVEWLERLGGERDNLRAALEYCLDDDDAEPGLRIAASLQMFWWIRGAYREGLERTEAQLARAEGRVVAPYVRAKALHRAGTLAQELGEYSRARALYEEALAIAEECENPQLRADALHSLGLLASKRGEIDRAAAFYEQCLELQRVLGDNWGLSATLNNMGVNLLHGGHFEKARGLLLESLQHKQAMGEKQGIAYAQHNLGTACYALGELDGSQEYVERSMALKRELADEQALSTSFSTLGRIALRRGRHELARERLGAALAQLAKVENRWTFTTELTAAVGLEVASGHPDAALRLIGFVKASCRSMEMRLPRLSAQELEEGRRRALERIDRQAAERLLEEGKGMTLGELAAIVAGAEDSMEHRSLLTTSRTDLTST